MNRNPEFWLIYVPLMLAMLIFVMLMCVWTATAFLAGSLIEGVVALGLTMVVLATFGMIGVA